MEIKVYDMTIPSMFIYIEKIDYQGNKIAEDNDDAFFLNIIGGVPPFGV